jgi:hypothetical protein
MIYSPKLQKEKHMGGSTKIICAGMLAATVLLAGCATERAGSADIKPPLPEPSLPVGYQKIAPAAVETSRQMLAQTATIFRGVLKEIHFTYDDCAGPRTNYVFHDATTLVGAQVQPQVTVRGYGGPTPYGTWVEISEHPQLALDSEYVIFLRNTDWTYSPIVGNLVFRRERVADREVLIDPEGYAVTGWGERGPLLSAGPVSEAVGLHLRRHARPRQELATSGSADPKPQVKRAAGPAPSPAAGPGEGSALGDAPSLDEIRKDFARPAVSSAALRDVPTFSTQALADAVKRAATGAGVEIGGRITLNPWWRCAGWTPTVRTRR